jgi:glyoxylase-like metal-dependent hydrolase (beta-lactamase superfamily II)
VVPAPGSTIEVAPGIHWLSTPLPFRLKAINLWLLEDGDGWTIVDCGYARDDVRAQWEQVWSGVLRGRPVRRLIVTHFHPDHAGNCAWICARWGLMPWMTQAEWLTANLALQEASSHDIEQRCRFYRAHGLDEDAQANFRSGLIRYASGVQLPGAYRRIGGGERIRIGARTWTVMLGQGHSPEHASLYSEEGAGGPLLIAGDQLLPEITTNVSVWPGEPGADALGLFLQSLDRFDDELDAQTLVLPSHRRPFRGAHARIAQLRRHHSERLDTVLRLAHQAPVTAGGLLAELFARNLDGHQVGFAMGEALAHLNYLVLRGALHAVVEGGITRYAGAP